MILRESEYREIYGELKDYSDIDRLYRKYKSRKEHPWEFFLVVYTQRYVRDVTSRFQRIKARSGGLVKQWKGGKSLIMLSRELEFSPVMTAFIVLTSQDYGRTTFRKMLGDPRSIKDHRLRKELIEVREADPVYAPEGNQVQRVRGLKGEQRLKDWLDGHCIKYRTEVDLRGGGGKTPDFLLERPIFYRGEEVNWIESKASFGDRIEVNKNIKRQLKHYRELFGPGMVIYWFGTVDSIQEEEGIIISGEEVISDRWDLE